VAPGGLDKNEWLILNYVNRCLRNAVSMFHILHMERQWRIVKGMEPGFSALERCKPILAVGATCPIEDQLLEHDYFRTSVPSI
jgi:hypothetical protein